MDIGGTTTDMAVLIQGAPVLDPLGINLGEYKTLIRSLETLSIGLGGPAPFFARYLESMSDYRIRVVPKWEVANAIGAALARTTCQVIFFADTERRIAEAPEENFCQTIDHRFDAQAAVQMAFELLKAKAVERGANPDHLEMEALETLEFNMVRGFSTTGKNIRVTVQVKPGLIYGYDQLVANLVNNR